MTDFEHQVRRNVRNFLFMATKEELRRELQISIDAKDELRARFVLELLQEA